MIIIVEHESCVCERTGKEIGRMAEEENEQARTGAEAGSEKEGLRGGNTGLRGKRERRV